MRRNAWFVLLSVAFAGLLSTAGAAEKSVSPVAYEEGTYVSNEIASLRAEIQSLREQMNEEVTAGYDDAPKGDKGKADHGCGCGGGCGDCGCCGCGSCCCDPCCRDQGFIWGAEVAWLKPHHSNGTGVTQFVQKNNHDMAPDGSLDTEYDAAYRLWLGYVRCDGLGFRLRYWQFDHGYENSFGVDPLDQKKWIYRPDSLETDNLNAVQHAWDIWVLDFEMTDTTRLGCGWDATLSAGLRYLEYAETIAAFREGGDKITSSENLLNGYGLTTGLEIRRALTCNLGGFINVRWSVIFADEDINRSRRMGGDVLMANGVTELNDVKFIYEAQAGVQYIRPMCCSSYLFLRAGFEAQYWDTFGIDNEGIYSIRRGVAGIPSGDFSVVGSTNHSVGFGGFGFSVGVIR